MIFKKRGLSPVIATVLLLVITVVAAGLIATFVVPFVKDSLSGSRECFDVLGDLSFSETPYNCFYFDQAGLVNRTGFSVKVEGKDIAGFKVVLQSGGNSDGFEIINGATLSSIRMLGGTYGGVLAVPQGGGIRTYVADRGYDRLEIYPIVAGDKKCDLADDINLLFCNDQSIINQLIL